MNNFFGKLSHMKDALVSKSGNIMNNVRKSVGLLTAATALSMGSGAMAGEWHSVDTQGIGPEAFAIQKFGNKDWKNLVDERGRYVLNPAKDLILGRKYTQKPVASGQSDTTATSAARIISTPRPQPKPEARINIAPIGEKSEGTIKEKNDAQTNSLNLDKDLKKKPVTKAPKKFEILSGFDMDKAIEKKNAEKIVSQVIQLKPEGRKNEELLCENPDSDKNSRIIKEVSQLDLGTLIATPPKETSQKTQMGPQVPGNIFSIQEARALRKPPENITAKQSIEKPIAIKKQSFLKKLFGLIHGDNLGLDIDAYKEAVAKIESGNKSYTARNDTIGKKKKIKSNKWAWGKYQFTTETLIDHGVSLKENGKISEKRVEEFLNDHDQQESIMNERIKNGLEIIKGKGKLLGTIETGKKTLPEILAKGHIAGHGSMDKSEIVGKNGKKKTDWLKTPISKYAKMISDHYLSIITKKGIIHNDTDSENTIPTFQAIQPEINIQTPTIQESKETIKPAIQAIGPESQEISSLMPAPELEQVNNTMTSANDTIFVTKYATNSVISNIEDKRIQKNIREKLEQFDNEIEGLMAIEDNHRKKAMELQIQAKNLFGGNYEFNRLKLREKAKNEINIANNIRKVIMTMSKAKKAA